MDDGGSSQSEREGEHSIKQYEGFPEIRKDSESYSSTPRYSSRRQFGIVLPLLIDKIVDPSEVHNLVLKYGHERNISTNQMRADMAIYTSVLKVMEFAKTIVQVPSFPRL